MAEEWRRGDYTISTDARRLDVGVIHGYLRRSYWANGIGRDVVARSIAGSFCFGLYHESDGQVGFARVITDFATTGYLADVFVLEDHRGHGLGVWLIETVMSHPRLQGFRVWRLGTRDAHGLYEKFGWAGLAHPDRMMEIVDPAVYADQPE